MPKRIGAGDLRERVHCQVRAAVDDDHGNEQAGEFATQFTVWAGYKHLRGGEGVLAARLENRHPVVIIVRANSQTRQITADWRLVDVRDGTNWAVHDVTHETDRTWISLLCERGVAA